MTTNKLLAQLADLINTLGPDDQEVLDFISTNSDNKEFVELGNLSRTLKRRLMTTGSHAMPLTIEYTNILHKNGGPESKEARVFVALHTNNTLFTQRAKMLNKVWALKKTMGK